MLPVPLHNLCPQPRSFLRGAGDWSAQDRRDIPLGGPAPCVDQCLKLLAPLGVRPARTGEEPLLSLRPGSQEGEAYSLTISSQGLVLDCSHSSPQAGFATLQQLLCLAQRGPIPQGQIQDSPALGLRGFMLDVSRDRVPTMEQLHKLIRTLAGLKYNHLELYTEHTFAYRGHDPAWQNASPLTPAEVRELDQTCSSLGLEMSANLNCLGHMHRWLTLPEYAHLAEDSQGMEHAFSVEPEPFSLCPTDPKSLDFARDLIDQQIDCYQSKRINVGLDETFDLGKGRSAAACQERGVGRVYLEFLQEIHAHLDSRGVQMLFWGDIIVQHPALVRELPKNAIPLLWGYEDGHPFEEQARLFRESGLDFLVVPGTSSWQSLLGRVDNARANLEQASRAALSHGARGFMVADWGDFGHWQPWPVSWPGLVLGAAQAWNPDEQTGDLAAQIELAIPEAKGHAAGIIALGNAHRALQSPAINGTSPFFHLRYAHTPMPIERAPSVTAQGLERLAATNDAALELLPPDSQITFEMRAALAICRAGMHVAEARLSLAPGSRLKDVQPAQRTQIREQLKEAIHLHREAWTLRSRPGGGADSLNRLSAIVDLLD